MSSDNEKIGTTLGASDDIWDQLTDWLERFSARWNELGQPPPLGEFAPASPPEVRQLVLVELIKLDMEYRKQAEYPLRQIEEYAVEFPELNAGGIPADLLYEDYHIRRAAGDAVRIEDYERRFPDQRESLRNLLQLDAPAVTTCLKATARPDDVQPGETLDDFELLTELGRGAFAKVFLARQRSLQRLVALKVSANRGSEPQTLAQLDHPNIVRVYDQRVLPDRDLRLLYMKYVPGGTLEAGSKWCWSLPGPERNGKAFLQAVNRALDQRGESPPVESVSRAKLEDSDWSETVCRVGVQLAQALAYSHAQGVLHRDLKPANVLLTAEAAPQLVDFNISFCSKLDGATPAAYFGGSLAYMSPEQLEACNPMHTRTPDSLTGASDVYSLGVVLWEMLTGSLPFVDEQLAAGWSATLAQMVERRIQGPDLQSARTQGDTPHELRDVVAKCLEADPNRRYATAAELAGDLRLCLQPEARRLLRPQPGGWVGRLRRFALPILLAAILVPNLVAGFVNLLYNYEHIIKRFPDSDAAFWRVQMVINTVFFPIGIALVSVWIWPVAQAVKRAFPGAEGDSEQLFRLRRRCLRIGHYMALLAILEWTLAGMLYPLAMQLSGVRLSSADNAHFFSSLLLFGLVAAAYPFFAATAFAIRILYPAFMEPYHMRTSDVAGLELLERWTWIYLALGLLVPMLALALMILFGDQQHRVMMGFVSAGSLGGFVFLVWLARTLQNTLRILRQATGVADKRSS